MLTRRRIHHHPWLPCAIALAAGSLSVPTAFAGGSPENMLLIIDPSSTESLYIGNYYKNARNIPDGNILYMAPGAANYTSFVNYNLEALAGSIANAGTADHIDYIVITPGAPFYVDAPGLVSDSCWPVARFSISAVYTMAFISNDVLSGTLSSQQKNHFSANEPLAFDSETLWFYGYPSAHGSARRYYIGAMLGYSGERGNTLAETIAMIDRSVAVDGTRPGGTFYFMDTGSDPRNSRRPQFEGAVGAIQSLGGQAVIRGDRLPNGKHDCLGVLSGAADMPFDLVSMTILTGAFGDHLTSWAATFDIEWQTKVSAWIQENASGSWGTVEEPCNYPGKFPHARFHYFYYAGSSLGEAALRSVLYVPFQGLLYGDPMTRPFAHLPTVSVPDAPSTPVSGVITLTPVATTPDPNAAIASLDLLIDGVLQGQIAPGGQFTIDTTTLADGWHDLRVLACDNTDIQTTGRWVGSMNVDNLGRSASLNPTPLFGNWNTLFDFAVNAGGDDVHEVRVLQNGRVVAAAPGASAMLGVYGLTLGAGPVFVQAEAWYADGMVVRGEPVELDVSYSGTAPSGNPPIAYGYTKRIRNDSPFVVELPATFDDPNVALTYEIVTPPGKATIVPGQPGPYRLMQPAPNAELRDTFTYRVSSAAGNSEEVTVTLAFDWWQRGDMDCDGAVDFGDINPFVTAMLCVSEPDPQACWAAQYPECPYMNADLNEDEAVTFGDINPFVDVLLGAG